MRVFIIIGLIASTASFNSTAATIKQELPEIPQTLKHNPPLNARTHHYGYNSDIQHNLLNLEFYGFKSYEYELSLLRFISNNFNLNPITVSDLSKPDLSNCIYFAKGQLKIWLSDLKENYSHYNKLENNIIGFIKHTHFSSVVWLFGSLLIGAWGFLNNSRKQTSI